MGHVDLNGTLALDLGSRRQVDPFDPDFIRSLGDWLTREGLVDAASRDRAIRAADKTSERFDLVLTKLGLIREADLLAALAKHLGLDLVTGGDLPREPVLPATIDASFVRRNHVLPLGVRAGVLTVAVADPFVDEFARALRYLTGLDVSIRLMATSDLDKAIQGLYADHGDSEASGSGQASRVEASELDLQRLRDIASEAPIIRLVNQIVTDAVEARASDIHIEPGASAVQVRYRVDGTLIPAQTVELSLRAAVTSRVKIMAKLDIAERRLPQDGRIKMAIRGMDVDLRISTLPTSHGESVVMRILDRSRVELDFAKLGFSEPHVAALRGLMRRPNGIILVTGPTGSGKTTTLYTALKELNATDLKIFTVEDPIEYQLAGINQVQVQPAIGLDFPHALRSILRQDPDVIMIGEIRDLETARIAIQSALTGHLVLSTLHTNSAAATVTRLIDMGVENYLLASTVNGILAQRLVRRLCRHCARPHRAAAHWAEQLTRAIAMLRALGPPDLREPGGCDACRNTGFAGRSTVAELLAVDDEIHGLMLASASDSQIDAAARRMGMINMYEHGIVKAWHGETTIEEVLRVTTSA